jgi:hypothetical protein
MRLKDKKSGSPSLFRAEFLAVEFARDVEFPTPQSNTSQETLSLYVDLKKMFRKKERFVLQTRVFMT